MPREPHHQKVKDRILRLDTTRITAEQAASKALFKSEISQLRHAKLVL